jgi:nucleotide-binding universal stress UspA family protein
MACVATTPSYPEDMKVTHILVPTDLSEESHRTFNLAQETARDKGARITLLNVVENLQVAPHGAPLAPPLDDPETPALVELAKSELEKRRPLLGDDVNVQCATTLATNFGEAIADYANEHGCDLIIMSTHGRTGFRRLVLGSVAESVLRHADMPVLCVPRAK